MSAGDPTTRRERIVLAAVLAALAATYALWFRHDDNLSLALALFALPPLLLAAGVLAQRGAARFWAGVFALGWFSHGVMLAWAEPGQRGLALAAVALSLVIVFLANAPGLRAKFGRRGRTP